MKNLPPELVDRINSSRRRCFSNSGIIRGDTFSTAAASSGGSSVYSGGWVPYSSLTKRSKSMAKYMSEAPPQSPSSHFGGHHVSSSHLTTSASGNPSVVHTADNAHWLSRNSVGPPEKTAWMINDKGNRVWFHYEHTPTLFPVTETRFYKPRLHKLDFLGKKEDESKGREI